ncbi:mitochondrial import receptor subunit TOM20 homolog [Pteropus medius]|uniref:mitochondrial import receptor subunit TOM20 homolog n=1 Tax=Pteropus vampyrus TaxID=132908 RepID=UPI00196A7F12|nr:mitochondrial import receptor subunit TOM20 homolog [Pteropus giganteus]
MVGLNSTIITGVCRVFFIWSYKRRVTPASRTGCENGEQRKKQKLAKKRAGLSKLPDLKNAEAVQEFFLEEIQLGEELLAQGESEKDVDHVTNTTDTCGQPQQSLQVLWQTHLPSVVQMLLTQNEKQMSI